MKNWKLTIAELKWTEKALAALALVYVGFHFLNLFMTFGPMGSKVIHISMGIGVLTLDLLRRHSGRSMKIVAAFAWVSVLAASAYFLSDHIGELTRYGFASPPDMLAGAVLVFWMFFLTGLYFGAPFAVVGIVFFVYAYLGSYLPAPLTAPASDLLRVTSKLTVGALGHVVELSVTIIFLLLVFGTFLQASGAGAFIWRVAGNLARRIGGGTGALTVVSSGLVASFTGVGAANVGITGPIAIPLMKRVGYAPKKAAAVEAAASVDGQIMPPVMGAAAFLMVEYVGIPYTEVIKHAFLPALISYIALFYVVHLEALKADIRGLPRRVTKSAGHRLLSFGLTVSGLIVLAGAVYYGMGWIKALAGDASAIIVAVLMFGCYIGLLWYATRHPELHMDDPSSPLTELPETGPTLKTGLYYLLPVVALIWNLMVEELSPALSAFWATLFMIFILVTQRPLKAIFRNTGNVGEATRQGFADLHTGLVTGARNMIGIGIATATAGIIVGTVTLTGVGLVLTEFVEAVSGGNLMVMLVMVAVICLILGMGLPTTANYIVVSTLMAPVVVEVGAQSGLLVPLIAVHMFVFYFGLMADVTPPVGLASYAAAGIARCDPIAAGVQAFLYSMRTAILPFMFIFNTQLLMIGVDSVWLFALTVSSAIVANLMFAAATQGWFITRNRVHESILLLLVTFTLFRPGFWMDMLYPPYQELPASELTRLVEEAPRNDNLRIWVEGISLEGEEVSKGMLLPLGDTAPSARERLGRVGLTLMSLGDEVQVAAVRFGSQSEKLGLEQGYKIARIEVPSVDRPSREWMFVPALTLLGFVWFAQARRARRRRTMTTGSRERRHDRCPNGGDRSLLRAPRPRHCQVVG